MSDGTQHASPAEGSPTRRRHGRRARQLSPEEQVALDARRAELEASGVIPVVPSDPEEAAPRDDAAGDTASPGTDPAAGADADTHSRTDAVAEPGPTPSPVDAPADPSADDSSWTSVERAGDREDDVAPATASTALEPPMPRLAPWVDEERRGAQPARFPYISGRPLGAAAPPLPGHDDTAVLSPIHHGAPTPSQAPTVTDSPAESTQDTEGSAIAGSADAEPTPTGTPAEGDVAETSTARGTDQSPRSPASPAPSGSPSSPASPAPGTPSPAPASGAAATLRDVQRPPAGSPTPTVRRLGRRARIVEIEEAAAAGRPTTATLDPGSVPSVARDADGVELGELAVGDAPGPRPAPRFEGRVLHRPERSGGNPIVWIVWALVALALIVLVALLLAGVIGPGISGALGALPVGVDAPPASSPLST